jgi:D-cysteine desulfhydrase
MYLPDLTKINLDKIELPVLSGKNIRIEMLRLDNIHTVISGNKWFKLKYHLEKYDAGNYQGLLTFGGSWSNHLVATACACHLKKIKCAGIIRGEKPQHLSATLQQVLEFGMELRFISRQLYKQKENPELLGKILKDYPEYYIIPEGGAGAEGEKGAGEVLQLVNLPEFTHIICAVGTATMLNGIAQAVLPHQEVIGIPVLKRWNEKTVNRQIKFFTGYHFGGYAKYNEPLTGFMNDFFNQTGIPTDFVYTGKMVFAAVDLANKNFFPPGSHVLLIHSGGLQGNKSLNKGTLIF